MIRRQALANVVDGQTLFWDAMRQLAR